jgi:uncharacterized protein (TIGR02270 family)
VPWLIDHMARPNTERVACEAFTLISGADLTALRLEQKQSEHAATSPSAEAETPKMPSARDEEPPLPDATIAKKWWASNARRFRQGTRYFLGEPVTRERCIDVLKNGYQRQRILAAQYLCLLQPGTPLFNTSAPAWRQQRLLAKME